MKLRWMPLAEQDLDAAYEYVREDNPKAAGRLVMRILQAAERLGHYPLAGHQGRVAGTRELTIARTPYIVAYRVSQDEIQILAVIHGAQRWPAGFGAG